MGDSLVRIVAVQSQMAPLQESTAKSSHRRADDGNVKALNRLSDGKSFDSGLKSVICALNLVLRLMFKDLLCEVIRLSV